MDSPANLTGLTSRQATERLARDGYNALPDPARRDGLRIALEVLREPIFLLLMAASAIYLLLGEPVDALMLLFFVAIAMSMTIFQEHRSERVLEQLRELSSPRALVVRDGKRVRIPGRELVVDDLMLVEEGDRVAADALLIDSHDLLLDESLLSGESLSVEKHPQAAEPRVYSGTMVVRGNGLARVLATGAATEIGRIGQRLAELGPERSSLQSEIVRLVRRFAIGGIALSLLVAGIYSWTRDDWLGGLLAGIALAMSVLPQEFAVVMTVFMGLGALRMSRHQVLTRHAPVIETLGSATVLCVDKTGTLTRNRMSVDTVVTAAGETVLNDQADAALDASVAELLETALLASETDPYDPMEKALHELVASRLPAQHAESRKATLLHEYGLSSEIVAMGHCWRFVNDARLTIATKGAPESVARLCGLSADETARVLDRVERLASRGMRVLAVARAFTDSANDDVWPATLAGFDFHWLGLLAFADPLRPEVPAAVAECQRAGIRVIMVTGDFPATAKSIAAQAGIPAARVVSGVELSAMDAGQLRQTVQQVHVYARVRPEQKLRLVIALRELGQVVAMTGDGINDAPALKAAHIGISMGQRGTDVAREASSLVLLEDDFGAIVQAVRMGRRIHDNLRKAIAYIIAAHIPIAGMALLPLLAGAPLALLPAHIMFLELIIDPACAIVFENEPADDDLMTRPPRPQSEALVSWDSMQLALVAGLAVLAAAAVVFFGALAAGSGEGAARALSFVSIVLGNLGLILVNRSRRASLQSLLSRSNPAQWWVGSGALASLLLVLGNDWLRQAFRFAPVDLVSLGIAALAAASAILIAEAYKRAAIRWL